MQMQQCPGITMSFGAGEKLIGLIPNLMPGRCYLCDPTNVRIMGLCIHEAERSVWLSNSDNSATNIHQPSRFVQIVQTHLQ
mmetsp:Transcript_33673/g.72643  ORF Transcript_33673/g.72643 Transcript_33673/m.72643 type:complete len:81 (-) Transcript_33673:98-340(-)